MSGSSGLFRATPEHKEVAIRWVVLMVLVIGYRSAFPTLYDLIGNAAFLLGLVLCLTAAVLLGLWGALVVIAAVAWIDRTSAIALPSPDTGLTAGIASLLVKLLLAGGLGLVLDSRRRMTALNLQLSQQIHARKQSEEQLRRSDELHRALVESLGEGVGLFDAEDGVVFANPSLAKVLKVSSDKLPGKKFFELVEKERAETLRERKPGLGATRSYQVALQGSASTLLLVTETNFEAAGIENVLTLRVVRDLTEHIVSERRQRDLERELQRSQSLQSLAVMAGGVAHDFNNLLCGVVGNAEVAQRRLPPTAPAAVSQCLREIITFGNEAAQLSKQMLAYAGQRSLAIEALDTNVELSNALRLLHATVESKARLVLDLHEALPPVAADRFQLRQVVTNLVLNGLDAMAGQRGVLTLRSEFVRLEADRAEQYQLSPGNYVKVTVQDTGAGISAEVRARLFEPFFSTKAPGRGMGLAAAAGIVRAHRGWLGIENTSERGTSFGLLLLCARDCQQQRMPPPAGATAPLAARSILLIDDELAVRAVTAKLLIELGQHVVTAESGQLGLELFSKRPADIDLIVLDLTMPEQSGEQILEALRCVREDVAVVITSGFQATDASKLLEVPNVIGFLEKPHTLSNLEMVLASAVQVPAPAPARP